MENKYAVAKNPSTPADVLTALAGDADRLVRAVDNLASVNTKKKENHEKKGK